MWVGTEEAKLPEKEFMNGIFLAVQSPSATKAYSSCTRRINPTLAISLLPVDISPPGISNSLHEIYT
jgi:hypothetical protein